MIENERRREYRDRFGRMLREANIQVLPREIEQMEITDFGLGHFESEGLGLIVYVNTDRYCAKELIMLPGQTCPQHRHPPVGGEQGKMETFRCRAGRVFLYVAGTPTPSPKAHAPRGKEAYYEVWHEIDLTPGQQYTIAPDTWHWFQAGPEGAIVSEFSSTSRDESDVFSDPQLRRMA